MASPGSFYKKKIASYRIAMDWVGSLPATASIAGVTVSSYDKNGNLDSSVIDLNTLGITGTQTTVKVQSGTVGDRYKLEFVMTADDGETVLADDITMIIT